MKKPNLSLLNIKIPDTLNFADLDLQRDPVTLDVSFDLAIIEQICGYSCIDIETFTETHEDNLSALIVGWYQAHRENGGKLDPVAEQLIAEMQADDAGYSVQPSPRVQ